MRVLQVITQDRGGPVDHALDLATALAAAGHESHLVGPFSARTGRDATLDRAGVRWHGVEARTKRDAAGAVALARTIAAVAPDVVHAQDRRAGLFGRLAARRLGVPSVYTLHGVPDGLAGLVPGNLAVVAADRRTRWGNLAGERWLARATGSWVVTPCAALGRYAVEAVGVRPDRLRVVHNGIDAAALPALDETGGAAGARAGGRPDDAPLRVVWVGLMQPVKRLPLLLAAVAACPEVELTLVGDGPERARVEALVAERGLTGRVRLTGFVEDPRAPLRDADLFVLPSAAEACPMALLQAMGQGLPVLASRAGGIPEIVRHGVDGWLVDTTDDAGWESALRKLAGDPGLRGSLADSGRDRVRALFTLERCVAGLLEVYGDAVSEGGR
ncbi:MAG: glycosyltransferase family 4 protein [Marmoricola sp.]